MFTQTLIVLFLGSHINGVGFTLDMPSRNARLYPDVGSRIVGGSDAPKGSADHMVAIVSGVYITSFICGGTIITKDHILTAAHCIDFAIICGELLPSYKGVIGSYKWRSEDLLSFTGFHIHNGWNPWTIKDDIGILVTSGIQITERVNVLPLNFDWMGGEEECVVTGWGTVGFMQDTPDRLQALNVSTIGGGDCARWVQDLNNQGWFAPAVEPHREVCTYHSPGHGMCHGDSGSALVHRKTRSQIGIVSWGFHCAVGAPDVFVRVSAYKDWVIGVVGQL